MVVIGFCTKAQAKEAESLCEKLKPVQTLSVEEQKNVDAAFNLAVIGWGKGGAEASTEVGSKTEMQVLASDDLARAWFVYQVCIQKEAGIIDEQTAQELVRKLMGLSPAAPAIPTSTAIPTTSASSKSKTATATPAAPVMPDGQGELYVKSSYQDAELIVDDKSYGVVGSNGTRMYLSAGYHDIKVKVKGLKPYDKTVQIKEGQTEAIDVTDMKKKSIVGWIILGVLVVAAIGGAVAVAASGGGGGGGGDTYDTTYSGTTTYSY